MTTVYNHFPELDTEEEVRALYRVSAVHPSAFGASLRRRMGAGVWPTGAWVAKSAR
jgi:hypothetical protein